MNAFLRSRRWFVIAVSTFIAGSEVTPTQEAKRSEVLIADFEAESYGDWKAEREAFSSGPAEGTLTDGEGKVVNAMSSGLQKANSA